MDPPHIKLHAALKIHFPMMWVLRSESTMSHGGTSKNESLPHQIFI